MITTFSEAAWHGLPFWDEVGPGEQCIVPCWPVDIHGNAVDCEVAAVLVGVMGEDGEFRAEDHQGFDPRRMVYVCPAHYPHRIQRGDI